MDFLSIEIGTLKYNRIKYDPAKDSKTSGQDLPGFFYDLTQEHWLVTIGYKEFYYVRKDHPCLGKFKSSETVFFTINQDITFNGLSVVELLIPFQINFYLDHISLLTPQKIARIKMHSTYILDLIVKHLMKLPAEQSKLLQFELYIDHYLKEIDIHQIANQITLYKSHARRYKAGEDNSYIIYMLAEFPKVNDSYIESIFPRFRLDLGWEGEFNGWKSVDSQDGPQKSEKEINQALTDLREKVISKYAKNNHRTSLILDFTDDRKALVKATLENGRTEELKMMPTQFINRKYFGLLEHKKDPVFKLYYGVHFFQKEAPNPRKHIFDTSGYESNPTVKSVFVEKGKKYYLDLAEFKEVLFRNDSLIYIGHLFIITGLGLKIKVNNIANQEEMFMSSGGFAEIFLGSINPIRKKLFLSSYDTLLSQIPDVIIDIS